MTMPEILLIIIVFLGVVVNLWMFTISFQRKVKIGRSSGSGRDEIARLSMNRAMRLEFLMFLAQFVRLVHTIYELHAPAGIFRFDWIAVAERGAVTTLILLASLLDLLARNKIVKKLDEVYPDTEAFVG